jgi:hypothetical protein
MKGDERWSQRSEKRVYGDGQPLTDRARSDEGTSAYSLVLLEEDYFAAAEHQSRQLHITPRSQREAPFLRLEAGP